MRKPFSIWFGEFVAYALVACLLVLAVAFTAAVTLKLYSLMASYI